jgi:hypothetical protein
MIWTGALMLIGYHGTMMLTNISKGIEYVLLGASLLFLMAMVYFIRRALRDSGVFEETPDA